MREAQETLTASWYVTAGEIDRPAHEITDPTVISTVTGWTAPLTPTTLEGVLVLRDSRGGSDATRAVLVVADRP